MPEKPTPDGELVLFGARLRDRRIAARLSRVALAQQSGLSVATIKFVEGATTRPEVSTIVALCQVARLGLTLEDLPLGYRARVQVISSLPTREIVCAVCKQAYRTCATVAESCTQPAPDTETRCCPPPESPPSSPSSA